MKLYVVTDTRTGALFLKSYSQAIFGTAIDSVPKVSEPNIGSIPSS